MLVPNGRCANMSAMMLSGTEAMTATAHQNKKGTSSVFMRFIISRRCHFSSSKCAARKNPDTTKKYGTAILDTPWANKWYIHHPTDKACSYGQSICMLTTRTAHSKLMFLIFWLRSLDTFMDAPFARFDIADEVSMHKKSAFLIHALLWQPDQGHWLNAQRDNAPGRAHHRSHAVQPLMFGRISRGTTRSLDATLTSARRGDAAR